MAALRVHVHCYSAEPDVPPEVLLVPVVVNVRKVRVRDLLNQVKARVGRVRGTDLQQLCLVNAGRQGCRESVLHEEDQLSYVLRDGDQLAARPKKPSKGGAAPEKRGLLTLSEAMLLLKDAKKARRGDAPAAPPNPELLAGGAEFQEVCKRHGIIRDEEGWWSTVCSIRLVDEEAVRLHLAGPRHARMASQKPAQPAPEPMPESLPSPAAAPEPEAAEPAEQEAPEQEEPPEDPMSPASSSSFEEEAAAAAALSAGGAGAYWDVRDIYVGEPEMDADIPPAEEDG